MEDYNNENQMFLLRAKQKKIEVVPDRIQIHQCIRCGDLIANDGEWYTNNAQEHGYIHLRCFVKT